MTETAVETAVCQIREGGVPCGEPAASLWAGSCVHEHVTAGIGICAAHEWRAEHPWICNLCEESAEPHVCLVAMTRTGQLPGDRKGVRHDG
jgi:hypothetical protein